MCGSCDEDSAWDWVLRTLLKLWATHSFGTDAHSLVGALRIWTFIAGGTAALSHRDTFAPTTVHYFRVIKIPFADRLDPTTLNVHRIAVSKWGRFARPAMGIGLAWTRAAVGEGHAVATTVLGNVVRADLHLGVANPVVPAAAPGASSCASTVEARAAPGCSPGTSTSTHSISVAISGQCTASTNVPIPVAGTSSPSARGAATYRTRGPARSAKSSTDPGRTPRRGASIS